MTTERYPKNLALAIKIAAEVHDGQLDKAGEHYILHCLAVMRMVEERYAGHHRRDTLMVCAALHDALEDFQGSPMERKQLEHLIYDQFGPDAYNVLDCLTRRRYESYDEFIERIAQNWMARAVKIADLTHNMDPRRIPSNQIVDKDFARWDKYRKALIRLERQ